MGWERADDYEKGFQKYYKDWASREGMNPDPDDPNHFYDYRAAYNSGIPAPGPKEHWPSTFKKEGHPRMVVDGRNTKTNEPVVQQPFESSSFLSDIPKPDGEWVKSDAASPVFAVGNELRKAPEPTSWDKIYDSMFRNRDKEIARAKNVYALSQSHNIPVNVADGYYNELKRSVAPGATPGIKEIVDTAAIPLITTMAVANPLAFMFGTAAYLGITEPLGYLAHKLAGKDYRFMAGVSGALPEDIDPIVKESVDALEMVAGLFGASKITKLAPELATKLIRTTITEHKLPEKMFIDAEKVKNMFQTMELTTADEKSILASLGLKGPQWRQAIKNGVDIELPAETIVKMVDKPWWGKVKSTLKRSPYERIISTEKEGGIKYTIGGDETINVEQSNSTPGVMKELPAEFSTPEEGKKPFTVTSIEPGPKGEPYAWGYVELPEGKSHGIFLPDKSSDKFVANPEDYNRMLTDFNSKLEIEPYETFIEKLDKEDYDKIQYTTGKGKAPTFFSKMYDIMSGKLPNVGTPESMIQLVNTWSQKGEFKGEELKWSGLIPYLESRMGEGKKVTKGEMLDYLESTGKIEIEEKMAGGAPKPIPDDDEIQYFGTREQARQFVEELHTDETSDALLDQLPESDFVQENYPTFYEELQKAWSDYGKRFKELDRKYNPTAAPLVGNSISSVNHAFLAEKINGEELAELNSLRAKYYQLNDKEKVIYDRFEATDEGREYVSRMADDLLQSYLDEGNMVIGPNPNQANALPPLEPQEIELQMFEAFKAWSQENYPVEWQELGAAQSRLRELRHRIRQKYDLGVDEVIQLDQISQADRALYTSAVGDLNIQQEYSDKLYEEWMESVGTELRNSLETRRGEGLTPVEIESRLETAYEVWRSENYPNIGRDLFNAETRLDTIKRRIFDKYEADHISADLLEKMTESERDLLDELSDAVDKLNEMDMNFREEWEEDEGFELRRGLEEIGLDNSEPVQYNQPNYSLPPSPLVKVKQIRKAKVDFESLTVDDKLKLWADGLTTRPDGIYSLTEWVEEGEGSLPDDIYDDLLELAEKAEAEIGEHINGQEAIDRAINIRFEAAKKMHEMLIEAGEPTGMIGGMDEEWVMGELYETHEAEVKSAEAARLVNYRELRFHWTEPGGSAYFSPHFGTQGKDLLAHTRFDDRIDTEGNKVLFLEEIQSDWHQKGREKGYKSQTAIDYGKGDIPEGWSIVKLEGAEAKNVGSLVHKSPEDLYVIRHAGSVEGYANGLDEAVTLANNLYADNVAKDRVSDAPFAKTWHEFVLKRMLRLAAEGGYDKLGWTTGEQQNKRWSLSQVVDRIEWHLATAADRSLKSILIHTNQGRVHTFIVNGEGIIQSGGSLGLEVENKPLSEVIGLELANRILTGEERGIIQGEGLEIGGEGMKGFYDKMIPSFLNKYGKQWGAKVGTSKIDTDKGEMGIHTIEITPKMKEAVLTKGQPLFKTGEGVDTVPEINRIFQGQKIGVNADNTIKITTKGGDVLNIEAVNSITPNELSFSVTYGRGLKPGEAPIGSYSRGDIKLVKGKAGTWELAHESMHWLEDIGILNQKEINAITKEIQRLTAKGEFTPTNPEDIGGIEDRANYLASKLTEEAAKKSWIRKIIDKIKEFARRLGEYFTGKKDIKTVIEDIQRGKVYDRQGVSPEGSSIDKYTTDIINDPETSLSDLGRIQDKIKNELRTIKSKDTKALERYEQLKAERDYLFSQLKDMKSKIKATTGQIQQDRLVPEYEALKESYKKSVGAAKLAYEAGTYAGIEKEQARIADKQLRQQRLEAERKLRAVKQRIREITGQTRLDSLVGESEALEAAMKKAEQASRKAYSEGNKDGAKKEHKRLKDLQELKKNRQALVDEVKGIVTHIKRLANQKMDSDYKDTLNNLLSDYDLVARSDAKIREYESFRSWVADKIKAGEEIDVPDSVLNRYQKKQLFDMTLDELRDLHETVIQMNKLGKLKMKLLANKRTRDFGKLRDEIIQRVRDFTGEPGKVDLLSISQVRDQSFLDKVKGVTNSLLAEVKKIELYCERLDNWEKDGPFHSLFESIAEAENREFVLGHQLAELLHKNFSLLKKNWESVLGDVYEVAGSTITKEKGIMVALNTGNEGNMRMLTEGMKLDADKIKEVVNTLSTEELEFVEGIWTMMESTFGMLQAVDKKLTGKKTQKVEGRYFPAVADVELSDANIRRKADEDLFETIKYRAKVKDGMTITRVGNNYPPRLNFDLILRHIGNVIHYITHAIPIRDFQRVISDPAIAAAMKERIGIEGYAQFQPWLKDLANRGNVEYSTVNTLLGTLRTNASVQILGMAISTTLMQPLALTQAIDRLGLGEVTSALIDFYKRPIELAEYINQLDPWMAERTRSVDRELREIMGKVNVEDMFKTHGLRDTYFAALTFTDKMVTYPAWWAAFNKEMKISGDIEKASSFASSQTRQSQASGMLKDAPGVLRGSNLKKLFTMFQTYFNSTFNELARSYERYHDKDIDFGQLVRSWWWLVIIPGVIGGIVRSYAKKGEFDSATVAKQTIGYATGTIPIAGSIVNSWLDNWEYKPSAVIGLPNEVKNVIWGKDLEAKLKHGITATGYLTGLPTRQGLLTYDFLETILDKGKVEPGRLLYSPEKKKKGNTYRY